MSASLVRAITVGAMVLGVAVVARVAAGQVDADTGTQHEKQAWAVSMDNDLFVPTRTDRDFTAGFAMTYGRPGVRNWQGLDEGLAVLDRLHGLDGQRQDAWLGSPDFRRWRTHGALLDGVSPVLEYHRLRSNSKPRTGEGNRNLLWGGLVMSRSF